MEYIEPLPWKKTLPIFRGKKKARSGGIQQNRSIRFLTCSMQANQAAKSIGKCFCI
jgi:hypothetical protein